MTTLGLGSISEHECVCKADSILTETGVCQSCGSALHCPKGSNIMLLLYPGDEVDNPRLKPGYGSDPATPLKIFLCQGYCPGGAPGNCQGEIGGLRKDRHNDIIYNDNTSVGRKFEPVEGLNHDLVCTGSMYHVHFAWQMWHGQLSPRCKFNKLKSFSGVEIDQNHVDKRILGGKGFAVGRLKRHKFCLASALRNRCCIDTKRCSGGYTQPQVVRLR